MLNPRRLMPAVVRPVLALVVAAAAVAMPAFSVPNVAAATPVAEFDWRMPDRYGIDQNGDGLFDVNPPASFIFPANWPVTLDACASNGDGSPITEYRWQIAGPGIAGIVTRTSPTCTHVYPFPTQGAYAVTLTITTAAGPQASKSRGVVVKDWLIVSMGDSIASGEGSPDIPAFSMPGGQPLWANEQCHRSRMAASSIAALVLELAIPHTSVTFVHLACSGATIAEGIVGPYTGIEPGALLPPQVQQLSDLMAQATVLGRPLRSVDALLLSIGANDMDFVEVFFSCVLLDSCQNDVFGRPDSVEAWKLVQDGLATLNATYPGMTSTLNAAYGANLVPNRVFITEYNDVLRNDAGALCDGILAGVTPGITLDETTWLDANFLNALNTTIRTRGQAAGWTSIGGIKNAYRTHGYCAQNHWIVQLTESFAIQADVYGTAHPNYGGQVGSAIPIIQALLAHPGFVPPGVFGQGTADGWLSVETARRWTEDLVPAQPWGLVRRSVETAD